MVAALQTPAEPELRRITRAEYDRLIDIGFFHEDEHVELLEGALVRMSPQGDDHARTVSNLSELFTLAFLRNAAVWSQLPLALSDDSEPEPDLALVSRDVRFREGKPTTAFLVVEVANSSVRLDTTLKARIYAQARIPEYWVMQVASHSILVHRLPKRGRYTSVTEHVVGGTLEVSSLPGPKFKVADLFGLRPKR